MTMTGYFEPGSVPIDPDRSTFQAVQLVFVHSRDLLFLKFRAARMILPCPWPASSTNAVLTRFSAC